MWPDNDHCSGCSDQGGKCQGVVDTGSSLLMGPGNLITEITKKLDLDEKCKKVRSEVLVFIIDQQEALQGVME